MAISRMQEPRQLYGLGSLVKGVKKAVKGVVKGVKDNPLLAAAALNFAPMLFNSKPFFGLGLTEGKFGLPPMFSNAVEGYKNLEGPKKFLAQAGIASVLSGGLAALAQEDQEEQEVITRDVGSLRKYLSSYYSNLGYTADEIAENVARDTSEYTSGQGGYADGGRIGFESGTPEFPIGPGPEKPEEPKQSGIMGLIEKAKKNPTPESLRELEKIIPGAVKEFKLKNSDQQLFRIDQDAIDNFLAGKKGAKDGGRIGYAMGTEDKVEMAAGIEGLPINVNPKGIKELDLRETGGFIAPVGVKEKADDIPAMLSNNEFVFTADAVKAAGGGSVDKGAQIMYDTMKQLESKVV